MHDIEDYPYIYRYDAVELSETEGYEYSFVADDKYMQSVDVAFINLADDKEGEINIELYDYDNQMVQRVNRTVSTIEPGAYTSIDIHSRLVPGKEYKLVFSSNGTSIPPVLLAGNNSLEADAQPLIRVNYMVMASNWEKMGLSILLALAAVLLIYGKKLVSIYSLAGRFVCMLLMFMQLILMVPRFTYQLENILFDPSWRYVLNVVGYEEYRFGKNLFFTYGPLGYICYLMNVPENGYTFAIGVAILILIVAINVVLIVQIYRLLKKKQIGYIEIVISTLMYITAYASNTWDNYFIYLLLVNAALYTRTKQFLNKINIHYFISNILLCIMVFSKFSTFTSAVAFYVLLTIYSLFAEEGKIWSRLRYTLMFVPSIVLIPIIYLIYCPSFESLTNYFKTMISVSANWMMSCQWDISVSGNDLKVLLLIIILYVSIIVTSMICDVRGAGMIFAASAPMFFAYKYATTRHGLNAGIWLFSLIFSAAIISIDWKKLINRKRTVCYDITLISCVIIGLCQVFTLRNSTGQIREDIVDKMYAIAHLSDCSIPDTIIENNRLPQEVIDLIGDSTVTVWPNQVALKAANPSLNMVYYPSIQQDLTVDSFLEEQDGAFFEGESAPEYVIVHCESMNDRIKYVDVPHVWIALSNNYTACLVNDDFTLLKIKSEHMSDVVKSYYDDLTMVKSEVVSIEEPIMAPPNADYVKIYPQLTKWGEFRKFFYHIPVTNYTICYNNGDMDGGRAIFPSMESGFSLEYYPKTNEELAQSVGNEMDEFDDIRIESIIFGGTGLKTLQKNVTVEWYSLKE